jgi:hypothetical protein
MLTLSMVVECIVQKPKCCSMVPFFDLINISWYVGVQKTEIDGRYVKALGIKEEENRSIENRDSSISCQDSNNGLNGQISFRPETTFIFSHIHTSRLMTHVNAKVKVNL